MPLVFINPLLRQLREVQDGAPWFEQSFRDKVGGISEACVFTHDLPEHEYFVWAGAVERASAAVEDSRAGANRSGIGATITRTHFFNALLHAPGVH